jgi:hypothetical protein
MNMLCLLPCVCLFASVEEPQLVAIDVHLVGLSADADVPAKIDNPTEFVREMVSAGNVSWSRRIQLTTIDQFKAEVQHGEEQPVVVGYHVRGLPAGRSGSSSSRPGSPPRSGGGVPGAVSTMQQQETGAVFVVTPRVTSDGRILLELDIEESRLVPAPLQEDEPLRIGSATSQVQFRTTVAVDDGKSALLRLSQSGQNAAQLNGHVLAVVSASVVK